MKTCIRCKLKYKVTEFNFKFKKIGIRQAQCRYCTRLYLREHYNKNVAYYLAKAKKRNQANRIVIKRYVWEYFKQNPCVDCGEPDPLVLEFDHMSDKISAVSEMYRNYTLDKVKQEIAKCQVRCANCHRRKTAKDFGWYKSILPL